MPGDHVKRDRRQPFTDFRRAPVALPSSHGRMAGPEFDKSSQKFSGRCRHCQGLFRPRERSREFKDQRVGINLGEAFTGLHSDQARERVRARLEVKLAPAEANNSLLGGSRNLSYLVIGRKLLQ
jgi:hypothetical protein